MSIKVFFLTFAVVVFITMSTAAFAEGTKGDFGIGVIANHDSPNIMFRWWTSDAVTLELTLGISYFNPDRGHTTISYTPGFGFLFHSLKNAKLRPYWSPRIGFWAITGEDTEQVLDLYVSVAMGAEYFFSDWFSVSGELQLVMLFTDDKYISIPGRSMNTTYVNTDGLLTVQFYF